MKEPQAGPKRDASGSLLPQPDNPIKYVPTIDKKYKPPKYKEEIFNLPENDTILINPVKDCSEKEIYQRNGFPSVSKNLLRFVAGGTKGGEFNDYYRPDNFGEYTRDNTGIRTNCKTRIKTYTFEKDTYFK